MRAKDIIQKYQSATIEQIQEQMPSTIYSEMVILSSKIADGAEQTILVEQALSKKWQELRLTCDTDGKVDRLIKSTEEYANVIRSKANERTIIEMIRSLKKLLTAKGEESRNYY